MVITSRKLGRAKDEIEAWRRNRLALGLDDRIEFNRWLMKTFSRNEMAAILEMDWTCEGEDDHKRTWLREVYLDDKYGGV